MITIGVKHGVAMDEIEAMTRTAEFNEPFDRYIAYCASKGWTVHRFGY